MAAATSLCLVVDHPGETEEQFETVMAHLAETGPLPPAGVRVFVSGPTEDGWRSISVWDSRESMGRFLEDRLAPAYDRAGLSPADALHSTFDVHTLASPAS